MNGKDKVVKDVTIYDTVLDTYTSGPPLPLPLFRFGAAYDAGDRKIYVFGGLEDADGAALDSLYVLDLEEGEWTEGPAMLSSRSDLCGAYVDGHVYAIGGYSLNFESTLDTVEALDIANGEWKEVKTMPTPRGDCKAAPIDGRVIVVGGYYDQAGEWDTTAFRNEVEIYSPSEDAWEEKAPMKYPRGDKAVTVLPNGRLLVVGGETHNRGEHTQVATHHVEEYMLSEDVWIDRAPLPYAVFRSAAAYVEGMVFVFGGHQTCDQSGKDEEVVCLETDVVQVYFDTQHPHVFIV